MGYFIEVDFQGAAAPTPQIKMWKAMRKISNLLTESDGISFFEMTDFTNGYLFHHCSIVSQAEDEGRAMN